MGSYKGKNKKIEHGNISTRGSGSGSASKPLPAAVSRRSTTISTRGSAPRSVPKPKKTVTKKATSNVRSSRLSPDYVAKKTGQTREQVLTPKIRESSRKASRAPVRESTRPSQKSVSQRSARDLLGSRGDYKTTKMFDTASNIGNIQKIGAGSIGFGRGKEIERFQYDIEGAGGVEKILEGLAPETQKKLQAEYEGIGKRYATEFDDSEAGWRSRASDPLTGQWLQDVEKARQGQFDISQEKEAAAQGAALMQADTLAQQPLTEEEMRNTMAAQGLSEEIINTNLEASRKGFLSDEEFRAKFGSGTTGGAMDVGTPTEGGITGSDVSSAPGDTAPTLDASGNVVSGARDGATAAPGAMGAEERDQNALGLTGYDPIDQNIMRNREMFEQNQLMEQSNYELKLKKERRDLERLLRESDVSDEVDPGMSVDEIKDLVARKGLNLSDDAIQRAVEGGERQLEIEMRNGQMLQANIDMTMKQLERVYGSNLRDEKRAMLQEDTKLQRMLGQFGGGQVETLAGNMEVFHAEQRGRDRIADLTADFGDKTTYLGMQKDNIISTMNSNMSYIQNEMNRSTEDAYVALNDAYDDLEMLGLTNENDYMNALRDQTKTYVEKYNQNTLLGAELKEAAADKAYNRMQAEIEKVRAEDQAMMDLFGVVRWNGEEVPHPITGEPLTVSDLERSKGTKDEWLTEQYGTIHINGKDTGVSSEAAKAAAAKAGITTGGTSTVTPTATYNPEKAQYAPMWNTDGSLTLNVTEGKGGQGVIGFAGQDRSVGDYQCGAFVNDVLGQGLIADDWDSKKAATPLSTPSEGAVFSVGVGGYGHVGIIEGIRENGDLDYVDANAGESGNIARGVIKNNGDGTYSYKGTTVHGFSEGMTPQFSAAEQTARDIFDPLSTMRIDELSQGDRPAIERELIKLRQAAIKENEDVGRIQASAGGAQITGELLNKMTAAKNVLGQLDKLEQDINNYPTGPVSQILSRWPYQEQAPAIQQQITALIPRLARGVFGEVGVLTDTDIERYKATIPNFATAEGAKKVLMAGIKTIVNRAITDQLGMAASGGFDVSGYAPFVQELNEKVDRASFAAGDLDQLGQNVLITNKNTGEVMVLTPQELETEGGPNSFPGEYTFTYAN